MRSSELLIEGFGRVREVARAAVQDLDAERLTARPGPDANPIGWLVWHLARVQDDHVAEVAGTEQVWTAQGWVKRFGLPFEDGAIGYGQSSAEVGRFSADAELLVGYLDAVHEATVGYLGTVTDEDLDAVVDDSWDPPVTLAVRLVSVLSDDLQHAGQAAYVRGLLA